MNEFDIINNSIYDVIINDFNNWVKTQKVDMNTQLKVDYGINVENDKVRYDVKITINNL